MLWPRACWLCEPEYVHDLAFRLAGAKASLLVPMVGAFFQWHFLVVACHLLFDPRRASAGCQDSNLLSILLCGTLGPLNAVVVILVFG